MTEIARIIGGAGTGKTTELLRLMDLCLASRVRDPMQIGFVSFTRAARQEAADRAADKFRLPARDLTDAGWFRTLHSVCYRCLGVSSGELVTDSKADREWVHGAVDAPVDSLPDEDGAEAAFEAATEAGIALRLWDRARNRLEPLLPSWELASECDDRTPPFEWCREIVDRYELGKRLDHRCDFVDLLGRFAGWRFRVDGPERATPEGESPGLPVWFFDEQQDTSALLDSVCHRLIRGARWVYVVGDPFQAIYGWAGADPGLFQGWEVSKQRILPQSFRCPTRIHEMGECFLREASDYWDRGIAPAEHDGDYEIARWTPGMVQDIDPRDSWLLIARTNHHAARLAGAVKHAGIPWAPTSGLGAWNAPARSLGLATLYYLALGGDAAVIHGEGWARAVDLLPAKVLDRGTKTRWQKDRAKLQKEWVEIHPEDMSAVGATDELLAMFRTDAWQELIPGADEWCAAVDRWGMKTVREPNVRIGTVHSVKGAEADNVLWLTTTSGPVARQQETAGGHDEECRVNYVACTRARRRLIVAVEPHKRQRARLPA